MLGCQMMITSYVEKNWVKEGRSLKWTTWKEPLFYGLNEMIKINEKYVQQWSWLINDFVSLAILSHFSKCVKNPFYIFYHVLGANLFSVLYRDRMLIASTFCNFCCIITSVVEIITLFPPCLDCMTWLSGSDQLLCTS